MTDVEQKLEIYFRESLHPIALAYLFGSHGRHKPTPLSDVDVAILLDEPNPERRRAVYLDVLHDLMGLLRPHEVDLILLGEESESVACRAVLEGRLIHCADEHSRLKTVEGAIRESLDREELDVVRSRYLRKRVLEARMGQGGSDMIDRRVVQERLDFIDGMVGQLKGYRPLSFDEFVRDVRTCHAALYELQTTLEAVADIGNHLIAALGLRRPEDRAEISVILAEGQIIPAELADRIRRAFEMRNGYLRIDLRLVHSAIREDLGDIEHFCHLMLAYLDTHP